jgi:lysophospholipase L1-like esterase
MKLRFLIIALSLPLAACAQISMTGGTGASGGVGLGAGSPALAFGDSITVGVGASQSDLGYAYLVAHAHNWTLTNNAVSGAQIQDNTNSWTDRSLATNVSGTTPTFMLAGYNDMRHGGLTANNLTTFQNTLYADVAWLAIPNANKLRSSSGSITYVGTWTSNNAAYGGTNPYKGSTTAGDTATATVSGTVIYLAFETQTAWVQNFTVLIDSVDKGPFSIPYSPTSTAAGFTGSLYFVRIPGLSSGTHTVQLLINSGSTNPVNLMYMAGNTTVSSAKVYVGNCLKMSTTGYAVGTGIFSFGSDAAVAGYNSAISQVVTDLAGDGLPVTYVDASAVYNPNTQVAVDNVHPNDSGHASIAAAFK